MPDIDWILLAQCEAMAIGFGLVIYHAVAAFYHIRYYRLRADDPASWKCQPKRFLRKGQEANAALVGSANLALGGAITGVFLYAMQKGLATPIFFDVAEYGWPYVIFSTALYFVVVDAGAYYVHRALHFKPLFRRFHYYHHTFIATSPYVATALHPVELLSLQAASFLPIFFLPLHAASIAVVLVYILVFNIIDHSGVRLVSKIPWQGPSMYHDDHHAHFHVNFGQHLTIWDRMHGTLRRKERTYGREVFGGRGAPDGEAAPAAAGFVDY